MVQTAVELAVDIIARWEKYIPTPYYATAEEKSRGLLTIGYGFTELNGKPVKITATMNEKEARKLLEEKVTYLCSRIRRECPLLLPQELAALTSLVFNIGLGAFLKSTILRMIKNGDDKEEIAKQFRRWNKQGDKELLGLTRRRHAEEELFLGRCLVC